MTTATQPKQLTDVLYFEEDNHYSREEVTVATTDVTEIGQVVGKITKGAATAAADAGNTGDGAIGAITVGAAAKAGDYRLTIIEPGANVGTFIVEDPDGIGVGSGVVGTAFSGGGLSFTLADGATDFVAGDTFTITVAAGSGSYQNLDLSATNGANVAAGVMLTATDASAADAKGVALVRHGAVKDTGLVWPAGITSDQKTAAITELEALGILVRTAQ
jgi:hypothetical protein